VDVDGKVSVSLYDGLDLAFLLASASQIILEKEKTGYQKGKSDG
jgi:hypothetical protein